MGVRIALFVCGIAQQTRANLEYSELFPYFHVAFDLERPQLQALQNRYFLHIGSPGHGIPLLHQLTIRIQSDVEVSDAVGVEGCRRGIDDTQQTAMQNRRWVSIVSFRGTQAMSMSRTGLVWAHYGKSMQTLLIDARVARLCDGLGETCKLCTSRTNCIM